MATRAFHITIGTAPSPTDSEQALVDSAAHDLLVVKAALLYADRVTLCSPMASLLMVVTAAADLKPREQVEFFEAVMPYVARTDADTQNIRTFFDAYQRLNNKLWLTDDEEALFRQLRGLITETYRRARQELLKLLAATNAAGLVTALESGLVALHPLPWDQGMDATVREFAHAVSAAVGNGETYPLFDGETGRLVSASIKEGLITVSPARIADARHTGLAANVLERLPLFDAASVEEVLAVRRELDPHLVPFRAKMIEFAETIASATWDADFPIEAERVFLRDVAPAVRRIEEEIRANSYLSELLNKTFGRTATPVGTAVITAVLSQTGALPAAAAAAFGLGTAGISAAVEAYRDWRKEQRAVEDRNQLFFYYGARERLHAAVADR